MLLSHPERLSSYTDLWIDCAGDEYAPGADGVFSDAPLFYFDGGRVRFDAYWFDSANDYYGSASAFLPQKRDLNTRKLEPVESLTLESLLGELEGVIKKYRK